MSNKGKFQGNNSWKKLQALQKNSKKSKKRKMDSKHEKYDENFPVLGSPSPKKSFKSPIKSEKSEILSKNSKTVPLGAAQVLNLDSPEKNLKVQSSKELLSLLKNDSKVQKSKYDSSQWNDENINLDDIEMAFGYEAAYDYCG